MNQGKLLLYTIMPLDLEHFDEVIADIKEQIESGVATCPLFRLTLVPEGNPPVDKAAVYCEQYDKFRDKLNEMGIPSGILVQASIGHGWVLSEMFPYQQFTGMSDGQKYYTVCPMDEGFHEYAYNFMRTIARHHPACVMLDDDFRLMGRSGRGCACPLHMKRFNTLAGTDIDRQTLRDAIFRNDAEGQRFEEIFVETQRESIIAAAKTMRRGIDSVNPKLPGSFCCVSKNAEFGAEVAQIMAGEGNPVVVRLNNSNYVPAGARYITHSFMEAAAEIAKLRGKVDVMLAETDTCPQNRYSVGAMQMHSHFVGSILEGTKGAKQWITRLAAHEPNSGKAYRKVLSKNRGFYEALAELEPSLKWLGFRIPVASEAKYMLHRPELDMTPRAHTLTLEPAIVCGGQDGDTSPDLLNPWCLNVLEKFGLPMYFSPENGGILCLEGDADAMMSDEQLTEAFKGGMFLSYDAAERLIARGFGQYIGVSVREWQGSKPSYEISGVEKNHMGTQVNYHELVPMNDRVVADSITEHSVDGVHIEKLFPAVTVYQNELGGTVVTFCGTPRGGYNLVEAFSFLNESRKKQMTRLMQQMNALPVYYPGDAEMYLRAAEMPDGGLFCAAFNLGLDPIEAMELATDRKLKRIEMLMPDGAKKAVSFAEKDGVYTLDIPCNTLEPLALFLYE